jgi:hypothetical protein
MGGGAASILPQLATYIVGDTVEGVRQQTRLAGQEANRTKDRAAQMNKKAKEQEAELKSKGETDEARKKAIKDRKMRVAQQKTARADANQKGGTLLSGDSGGGDGSTILGDSGKKLLGS